MKSVTISVFILLYTTCFASTCSPGNYIYNGSCQACPKGMFQDKANQGGCKPCEGNTVAIETGSTSCEKCGRHSKAAELKHECECNENAYRDRNKCSVCKPGYVKQDFGRSGSGCIQCHIGFFQPSFGGVNMCEKCPNGTTSKKGGTRCVACKEGEYVNKNENCVVCRAGFGRRDDTCKKCLPNEFKSGKGFQPCLPCPPGSFSHGGARRCKNCPPGTRLMRKGRCGTCAAGERYDEKLRKCVKCEVNSFMPYRNIQEECYGCAGNAVAKEGSARCTPCRFGSEAFPKGSCGVCSRYAIYDVYDGRCVRCELNEVAREHQEACEWCGEEAFSLPRSNKCFTCPRGQALILKKRRCGSCGPGRTYDSSRAKCEKCAEGSVKSSRGVHGCSKCEEGMTSNRERTACIVA